MSDRSYTTRHTLILVLTAFLWGTTFVAQSVGAEYVGAFTFLASRSWIGLGCVMAFSYFWHRRPDRGEPASTDMKVQSASLAAAKALRKKERRNLWKGGILCGCLLFAASLAQQAGIAYTTTAKSGFLTTMYVVLVPILSWIFGRRPNKRIWACAALSLAGLYLLCLKPGQHFNTGDSLTLLCALIFSGQIMGVNYYADSVDPIHFSAVQFLTEAVLATAGMLVLEPADPSMLMLALPAILFAGFFSSGVAYTLQIIGQKGLDPTIASLAMCLESVFSAIGGWVLLHQAMSPRELAGAGLMFAAIVLSQLCG